MYCTGWGGLDPMFEPISSQKSHLLIPISSGFKERSRPRQARKPFGLALRFFMPRCHLKRDSTWVCCSLVGTFKSSLKERLRFSATAAFASAFNKFVVCRFWFFRGFPWEFVTGLKTPREAKARYQGAEDICSLDVKGMTAPSPPLPPEKKQVIYWQGICWWCLCPRESQDLGMSETAMEQFFEFWSDVTGGKHIFKR